jgi:hypothetical protein
MRRMSEKSSTDGVIEFSLRVFIFVMNAFNRSPSKQAMIGGFSQNGFLQSYECLDPTFTIEKGYIHIEDTHEAVRLVFLSCRVSF